MNRKDDIDTRLNSAAQQAVRKIVRDVPEDSVSLAWRSGLNERLIATSKSTRRRQSWRLVVRPALGLGFAASLAMLLVLYPATKHVGAVASRPQVEAALVLAHEDATSMGEVTGAGLTLSEASYVPKAHRAVETPDWSEVDTETL